MRRGRPQQPECMGIIGQAALGSRLKIPIRFINQEKIGRLKDIVVHAKENEYPKMKGLVFEKGKDLNFIPYQYIENLSRAEVTLKKSLPYVAKEVGAGVINGAINGVLVAAVAVFINKSPMLGLVLAVAMIINLFIAALAGAVIPLVMKSLGKDPATSATIFITTCTDVGGFFVFLGLAQLVLT